MGADRPPHVQRLAPLSDQVRADAPRRGHVASCFRLDRPNQVAAEDRDPVPTDRAQRPLDRGVADRHDAYRPGVLALGAPAGLQPRHTVRAEAELESGGHVPIVIAGPAIG